jgi:hypothetical protein
LSRNQPPLYGWIAPRWFEGEAKSGCTPEAMYDARRDVRIGEGGEMDFLLDRLFQLDVVEHVSGHVLHSKGDCVGAWINIHFRQIGIVAVEGCFIILGGNEDLFSQFMARRELSLSIHQGNVGFDLSGMAIFLWY